MLKDMLLLGRNWDNFFFLLSILYFYQKFMKKVKMLRLFSFGDLDHITVHHYWPLNIDSFF